MTIEERTTNQYARVFKDWQIDGGMIGHGSQGKTAVFKIKKVNPGFTEIGALKIVNIYETSHTGECDDLKRIDEEILSVKRNAEIELAAMNLMKGHGNIICYHEFAFEEYNDDLLCGVDLLIRMDYYENVGQRIKAGISFSESEIIRLGTDVSRALMDCHNKGILHRDIKPDNIFHNDYGYLLGDFGIAKLTENNLVASTMAGSYPYSAPEQINSIGSRNGEMIYDNKVDIYALGLTLYELANNGKIPFATSTYKRSEDIQKRLNGERLPELAGVSKELESVILKACAYNPKNRYQNAEEMLRAFENLSSSEVIVADNSMGRDTSSSIDETYKAMGGFQEENQSNSSKTIIVAIAVFVVIIISILISVMYYSEKSSNNYNEEAEEGVMIYDDPTGLQ